MKRLVVVVLLVSCVSGAALADGKPEKAEKIENLLDHMPLQLAVSSAVVNPAITPYDMIDLDAATAWNSRTGDLVGAWIAVRVPPTQRVDAVTLTAGFDATGPEGDYFTLNHRIKRVAVFHGKTKLREVDLDVDTREAQRIPVGVTGGDIRIEVLAVVPGTKAGWREIAVSELEVLGPLPAGAKYDASTIAIGSLDAKPLPDLRFELSELKKADSVAAFCTSYVVEKTAAKCESYETDCAPNTPPACGATLRGPALPKLPYDWKGAWFATRKGNHTATTCNLAIASNNKVYILGDIGGDTCGAPVTYEVPGKPDGTSRRSLAVLPAGDHGEPVLAFEKTNVFRDLFDEELVLCARNSGAGISCGTTNIGRIPTSDGHRAREWAQAWSAKAGVLTIRADSGVPDGTVVSLDVGVHPIRPGL